MEWGTPYRAARVGARGDVAWEALKSAAPQRLAECQDVPHLGRLDRVVGLVGDQAAKP
jgi:hypothetical protein